MRKRRSSGTTKAGKAQRERRRAPAAAPAVVDLSTLPEFCDYQCPRADFPPSDAVGACRREQAVWCGVLKRYNVKNGRCLVRGGEEVASRK